VFDIADDIVILNSGQVAIADSAAALRQKNVDLRQYLGVF
jgi:ABC-type branched-subunit amino acid transport system ATPase component